MRHLSLLDFNRVSCMGFVKRSFISASFCILLGPNLPIVVSSSSSHHSRRIFPFHLLHNVGLSLYDSQILIHSIHYDNQWLSNSCTFHKFRTAYIYISSPIDETVMFIRDISLNRTNRSCLECIVSEICWSFALESFVAVLSTLKL